jgi:DNA-binding XRE family transcriptional regulator
MITATDLKRARTRRGETQEQFAAHFGVGRTTILNWETKGPPSTGTAPRVIAQVLADLRDKMPQEVTE